LKAGVDILIASPGRLIEMLKKKATNLTRVTYLVLDEADRMLSLGFEQQIRSIVGQTREDRQTLLFTATMKQSMQFLVNDIIMTPVRINIGEEGAANEDVKQEVVILQ
jgi:ATP-dependent RNA helicase DDX42